MKLNNTNFAVLVFATSLLVACGGGGGGGSDPQPTSGIFIDSAVSGLHYVSGDLTGTTDASGTFQCQSTVKFYIGDILLGEASCGDVITPVDLVSGASDYTDPAVINIARFLQTLDDDGDPSNGIVITSAVAGLAADESVDFAQSATDFESNVQVLVNTLTSARTAGATNLISAAQAQSHLGSTLAQNGIIDNGSTGDGSTECTGSLSLSGADTALFGASTITPNNYLCFSQVGYGGIGNGYVWGTTIAASGQQAEVGVVVQPVMDQPITLGGAVLFNVGSGTENDYSYMTPYCSTDNCSEIGVTIDETAKTVTFSNVVLNPDTTSNATSTITISGTVNYYPAVQI